MSVEILEMDIDQRGGKADGISLSYGKLRRVTQPDQCPLCLFSPFTSLWGTFKAQTCSRVWGTKRRESARKQMCEKVRGSSGLLVRAFDQEG